MESQAIRKIPLALILNQFDKPYIMIQENLNEEINPRDVEDTGTASDREKEVKDDEEESYDILPSNSAGLEGNDGQQVINEDDEDDDDKDD